MMVLAGLTMFFVNTAIGAEPDAEAAGVAAGVAANALLGKGRRLDQQAHELHRHHDDREVRRRAAEQNLKQNTASEALRRLLELRPAFAGLAVYPDDFSALAKGLERSYRASRSRERNLLKHFRAL